MKRKATGGVLTSKKEAEKMRKKEQEKEDEEERKRQEEAEERELEEKCEKWCGRACTLMMVLGPTIPFFEAVSEFVARPVMVIDTNFDLEGQQAIVTGGCDGIGEEVSRHLLQAGASVILGCRNMTKAARVVQDLQRKTAAEESQIQAWPLELDSFASVESFADRFLKSDAELNLLINNAGTKEACVYTEDHQELALQVNHLAHFLLTNRLLPKMKAAQTARVVHVVCDAAYDGAVDGDNLNPSQDATQEAVAGVSIERCSAAKQYATAKLAQLAFSDELDRRLRAESGGEADIASIAVDPGTTATSLHSKAPPASPRRSLQQRILGYLPPFLILGWLRDYSLSAMERSIPHGAGAVVHAATNPALSRAGGGLYSDRASALFGCGKPAVECGLLRQMPNKWSLWGRSPRTSAEAARMPDQGTLVWRRSWELLQEAAVPEGEGGLEPLEVPDEEPREL
mmetsp:Transcript_32041/g.72001  ORF Transcript_32041/g.72001 Transcript_32041/m.72001 type:complete len:457 (+) Transcript_32041:34-1404(+)